MSNTTNSALQRRTDAAERRLPQPVTQHDDGRRTDRFPTRTAQLERATPVYEDMPGWTQDIGKCRTWDSLPPAARDYIGRIEALLGAFVIGIVLSLALWLFSR